MTEPPSSSSLGPEPAPLLDLASAHPVQRDYSSAASAALCGYCSAVLDPFYYFCLRCGAPYKSPLSLLGPARPMPLSDAQRIERLAPHTWTVFWTYAAVVIVAGVVGAIIASPFAAGPAGAPPSPMAYTISFFISSLAIFVTTAIFTFIHWRPLVAQFKNIGFLKWEAWAGLAALVPLLLINYIYHSTIKYYMHDSMPDITSGIPLPVQIALICVFPAITEEIAFRGLVQYWLDISLTPGKALLLGSALFAGLHFSIISFPYLFTVGMLLAMVRRRTGSLYPGMLIHFLHNLVVITLFGF